MVLGPQKCIKFLGYIVYLVAHRLTVDPSRAAKITSSLGQLLARPCRVHVRNLARVKGLLQSMHLAAGQSFRILMRSLYDLINQKPLNL